MDLVAHHLTHALQLTAHHVFPAAGPAAIGAFLLVSSIRGWKAFCDAELRSFNNKEVITQ